MALIYQLIWNEIVKTYKVIFYVNVTQTNCELCHIFHCFNESVRHTRGVVLWVSTLEYSRSIGPQFDLIKFNSSTLYFASGLFPLCLNNNCSAVELWSPCLSYEKGISAKSWRKKRSPWWYPLLHFVEEANGGQSGFNVPVSPLSSFVMASSWSCLHKPKTLEVLAAGSQMFWTFKTLSTSTFVREKTKTVHPLLFVV